MLLVLRIDVIKQYLINNSIPNFNEGDNLNTIYYFFFHSFKNISYQLE